MEIKEVHKNIYLCTAKDKVDLNTNIVRLQEFYESKYEAIRGKYFTLSAFKKLYAKDNGGKYTYEEDWVGNNIPGYAVRDFYNTFPHFKLTAFEKRFKKYLIKNRLLSGTRKFYVIAIIDHHSSTFQHELAHAFYHLYPHYKDVMQKYMATFSRSLTKQMETILGDEYGYTDAVFADEMQAYCATETVFWLCDRFDLTVRSINWETIFKMQTFYWSYRNKVEHMIEQNM